jgi:uncharacterized membrane protein YjjP (DUF1212 family)
METAIAAALFLALCNERIINALITPIFDKAKWDKFWITYISLITGAALSVIANINLFYDLLPRMHPTAGLVLTAIVIGGGSNLLHDLFKPNTPPAA